MTTNIIWSIVAAVRITEGVHSAHPYGIMVKYHNTTPQQACFNTVQHFAARRDTATLTPQFIFALGRQYCPPSVDPVGYHNWTNNMCKQLFK